MFNPTFLSYQSQAIAKNNKWIHGCFFLFCFFYLILLRFNIFFISQKWNKTILIDFKLKSEKLISDVNILFKHKNIEMNLNIFSSNENQDKLKEIYKSSIRCSYFNTMGANKFTQKSRLQV